MTLTELIALANTGYPDQEIDMHFNARTRRPVPKPQGDSLAWLIVRELYDTFSEDGDDTEQLKEAVRALQNVRRELDGVLRVLENNLDGVAYGNYSK